MNDNEFERNFKVESSYWWNIGRFKIIESFTKRYIKPSPRARMVDLGCGTGATTLWLQRFGKVKGVDGSPQALRYCKRRGLKDLTLSDMEKLKLPSNSFDAAFALDILEHVKDDDKAMREIHRILKPGAKLLVTSPAYQWLWSEHDEVCHHYRRYTLSEIVGKLKTAGFQVRRQSYCIVFPFFPLMAMLHFRSWFKKDHKIMMSIVPLPKPFNDFLIFLLRLENFFLRFIDFPFGVSVICLVEKPGNKPSPRG
jgi:ubiquinone/menaquinone biosynthesis C-methylase UbiE